MAEINYRQQVLDMHGAAVRERPELAAKLDVWTWENDQTGPITRTTAANFRGILAENGLGHLTV